MFPHRTARMTKPWFRPKLNRLCLTYVTLLLLLLQGTEHSRMNGLHANTEVSVSAPALASAEERPNGTLAAAFAWTDVAPSLVPLYRWNLQSRLSPHYTSAARRLISTGADPLALIPWS